MSSVIRVPDDVYRQAQRVAAVKGVRPGDLLAEAFEQWVANHSDEILAQIDALAEKVKGYAKQ